MKRKTALLLAACLFLAAAAGMITYSLTMIIGSQVRAGQRLDEWNALLTGQAEQEISPSIHPDTTVPAMSSGSFASGSAATPAPTKTPTKAPTGGYKRVLLGALTFPSLKNKQVIVTEGTTNADLRGAAGHATWSAQPGNNGNCIVYGHRDGVFKDFKNLKIGDRVKFKTLKGETTYQIISMTITKKEDPLISRTYSEPMLTLVTCYPFVYVGHAPNRYVVIARLV